MFSVLFADDEPFILKAISMQLKNSGFNCDTANNGEEAMQKIKEKKYDLILLDIAMPKKNGNQVLCETRDLGIKTPIFMLTGDIEESSKKLCMAAGANKYINKPFEFSFLMSVIKSLNQEE